jgi:deoxycytidylate deaminase
MEQLEIAKKIAGRSSLKRYKTGCVIVRNGKILSMGWSHYGEQRLKEYRSIHAELHAIRRAGASVDLTNSVFYIATRSERGTFTTGKPCHVCQRLINNLGAHVEFTKRRSN